MQSYIGSAPIPLPQEVTFSDVPKSSSNSSRTLRVHGPKGDLAIRIPTFIKIENQTTGSGSSAMSLSIQNPSIKEQRAMWGTTRALLANSVKGVSEGFTVSIKFVGVGYRAAVEESTNAIVLRVGYSKPVLLTIPAGISAKCPQPTALLLEGRDKQVLTQFAAVIRSYRPPEPYKGKGIFVNNETIKIKSPAGKK